MYKRVLSLLVVLCAALCALFPRAIAEEAGDYYIEVDLASQITTVYRTADGSVARQMICSTGTGKDTPRGTFRLARSRDTDRAEWYWITEYRCFVKFPTRIQGHILFHSIPYASRDMATVDAEAVEKLGFMASHGCIRLRWQDAKWIATHCPDDTLTRIFTGTSRREALRALLLRRSYTGAGGMDYEAFTAGLNAGSESNSLLPGASGEAVERLQRRLGARGYYSAPVTGVYDALTVAAVIRCQGALGLWENGVADAALMEMLARER